MASSAAMAGTAVVTEPALALTVDQVVQRYWPRAHRFAAMVTRNSEDAADVAQEAMERVIRKLDSFDAARGTFDAWLWRVVVNTARDAGRATTRRAGLFDRLVRYRDDDAADAESLALKQISDRDLLEAVRRLKVRPRTLIALRFGARLSFAEIAQLLSISEAAATMATRRALDTLRRRLKENG